jgi:hypothetical protein
VGNQNDNVAFKRRAYMSVNSEQSHGGSDSWTSHTDTISPISDTYNATELNK